MACTIVVLPVPGPRGVAIGSVKADAIAFLFSLYSSALTSTFVVPCQYPFDPIL